MSARRPATSSATAAGAGATAATGVAPTNPFFNGPNYNKIVVFLRQHYSSKLGTSALPERMDGRLQTTVQHYMKEVARIQGPGKPLNALNQEVVREATSSIDTWLRKQESAAPPTTASVGSFARPDEYSRLFEDTNTRYETLMADRAPPPALVPAVPAFPDFRPSAADPLESGEDPVLLMQRMQKQREDQARMLGLAGPAPMGPSVVLPSPPRLDIKEETVPSAANPVPPQAEAPPALLAPRPQDYIIPQEDIVKYRETEINLFVTSGDRDWLRNTSENRYNFTVNFNTGTKKQGYSFNAAIQKRLRNIQRIEFVKAILPIESLTTLVRVPAVCDNAMYDTTRVVNIFSLPFVGVRIDELEPNGFSTRPEEDATFAIIQYDTTWSSDLLAPAVNGTSPVPVLGKTGYTGFIPKFLKTQRVYTPTPLATLQKMSIQVEDHAGALLSTDSDVHSIARICMSSPGNFTSIGTNGTVYTDITGSAQNSYLFVQTTKYFAYSAVSEGDSIQIQGYVPKTVSAAASDFASYINTGSHYIIAVGSVVGGTLNDGRNAAGYCNVLVLRSRFDDPTTGSTVRISAYFGGSSGAESTLATQLNDPVAETNQSGAALLNLNRQTHMVLRVVVRDMDSGSNIRPDNV